MRIASMVIGLITGILVLISAVVLLVGGLVFSSGENFIKDEINRNEDAQAFMQEDFEIRVNGEVYSFSADGDSIEMPGRFAMFGLGVARGVLWVFVGLLFAGGVLGVIGAAIVRRNHVAAGVLMLIAAFVSLWGFALFVLAGIFALVPDKRSAPPAPAQPIPAPPAPPAQ